MREIVHLVQEIVERCFEHGMHMLQEVASQEPATFGEALALLV